MNSIDSRAGVLIVTHRTPRVIAEVIRVFMLYWCQMDANHALQMTFEYKPIADRVEFNGTELLDTDTR